MCTKDQSAGGSDTKVLLSQEGLLLDLHGQDTHWQRNGFPFLLTGCCCSYTCSTAWDPVPPKSLPGAVGHGRTEITPDCPMPSSPSCLLCLLSFLPVEFSKARILLSLATWRVSVYLMSGTSNACAHSAEIIPDKTRRWPWGEYERDRVRKSLVQSQKRLFYTLRSPVTGRWQLAEICLVLSDSGSQLVTAQLPSSQVLLAGTPHATFGRI